MTRAIRWWTSPACARVLERLECQGEASALALSQAVHIAYGYAKCEVMPALLAAERVRVTGWLRQHSGQPLALYSLGPGPSVPMPAAADNAARLARRRRQMAAAYGVTAARKVLQERGAIVRDGKRLRTAGFGRTAGQVVRGVGA